MTDLSSRTDDGQKANEERDNGIDFPLRLGNRVYDLIEANRLKVSLRQESRRRQTEMPYKITNTHFKRKPRPIGKVLRNDEEAVRIRSSARWTRLSKLIRQERPICEHCMTQGHYRPSQEVHHIRKVATHPHLAFTPSNLQALCRTCHIKIEQQQSGGHASK